MQAIVAVLPAVFLKWGGLNIKFQVQKTPLDDDKRIDDVVLGLVSGALTLFVALTNIHDDPFPDDHVGVLVSFVPMGQFIKITGADVVFNSSGLLELIDMATGLITDYVRSVVKDQVASAALKANWALTSAKYRGPLPGADGAPGHALASVTPGATAIDSSFLLSGVYVKISRDRQSYGGFDDPTDDPDVVPTTPVLSHDAKPFPVSFRAGQQDPAIFWPIRARFLGLEILDHPTLRRDPSLRTAWTIEVERQDQSTVAFSQDRWSDEPGGRTLTIDLWSDDYYLSRRLDVRCEHYRPPDQPGPALASVAVTRVYINDRFRRDFPFVRWRRDITWMETVDGTPVPKSNFRESAVHKTDIRQRRQFCDVGGKTKAYNSPDQTQYLTSLPAPAEKDFRVALCPYCFPSRLRRSAWPLTLRAHFAQGMGRDRSHVWYFSIVRGLYPQWNSARSPCDAPGRRDPETAWRR